jgi:hypothetical protein
MAFLEIPIFFVEDDVEQKEACNLEPRYYIDNMTINTKMICAYCKKDNGHPHIKMVNGEDYESPMSFEEFEIKLFTAEAVPDFPFIQGN